MNNKLISIIIPTLDQGGAERSFVQIANGLHSAGCNVQLVTALNADGPYKSEVMGSVPFINIDAKRFRYLPRKLCNYINTYKPDIILTALINNWVLALKPFFKHDVKIIISERTTYSCEKQEKKGFISKIGFQISKMLYPKGDIIATVSQGVADDLVKLGLIKSNKTRVVYNPVISDNFFRLLNEKPSLDLLNPNIPNFIAVGRLTEAKNYPLLLNAFAILNKKLKSRLVIFGEGELRNKIELQIKELGLQNDVLMPGFVQNPFPYIAMADCFVLSSDYEGLPGVLIQALGCGTTVVSTDCPSGPSEILDGGKYGTLVPVGNVEALAQAMKNALNNPYPSAILKDRAMFFSEENCIKAYMKLFDELSEN